MSIKEEQILTTDTEVLKAAYKAIDDKFGIDTKVLNVSGLSSLADYFIITSGTNPNQIKAIADAASEALHRCGINLRHSEGYGGAGWVLLDFGHIIVHIFDREGREFYNIERVWADADFLEMSSPLK